MPCGLPARDNDPLAAGRFRMARRALFLFLIVTPCLTAAAQATGVLHIRVTVLDAKVAAWLPEPPEAELKKSVRRLAKMDDVVRIALMPDAHVADSVCVGTVVATRQGLYPEAVGGDVGCGMAAV